MLGRMEMTGDDRDNKNEGCCESQEIKKGVKKEKKRRLKMLARKGHERR